MNRATVGLMLTSGAPTWNDTAPSLTSALMANVSIVTSILVSSTIDFRRRHDNDDDNDLGIFLPLSNRNTDNDDAAKSASVGVDATSNSTSPTWHRSLHHFCFQLEFIMVAVVCGVVSLIGLVGAVLSFVGLTRDRSMSPAASFILRALACADAVLLVSWIMNMSLPAALGFFEIKQYQYAAWVISYRYIFNVTLFTAQTTVSWLTVLVAIYRWASIKFPYRAVAGINRGARPPGGALSRYGTGVIASVAAVVGSSIAFNLPRLFRELPMSRWGSVEQNITVYHLDRTEMAQRYSYRFVYAQVLYSLVNFGLPFLILIIFSVLLLNAYQDQRRRRAAMKTAAVATSGTKKPSGHHDNEHNTTLIVVAVVVTFGICNLPAKVLMFDAPWRNSCETHHLAFRVTYRLSLMLELANSIGNFFVCCAFRRQFRQAVGMNCDGHNTAAVDNGRGSGKPVRNNYPTAGVRHTPSPTDRERVSAPRSVAAVLDVDGVPRTDIVNESELEKTKLIEMQPLTDDTQNNCDVPAPV